MAAEFAGEGGALLGKRSSTATSAPSEAKRRAISAPIPRAPPVTTMRLPTSRELVGRSVTVGSVMGGASIGAGGGEGYFSPMELSMNSFV